jgi:hypothetical protein
MFKYAFMLSLGLLGGDIDKNPINDNFAFQNLYIKSGGTISIGSLFIRQEVQMNFLYPDRNTIIPYETNCSLKIGIKKDNWEIGYGYTKKISDLEFYDSNIYNIYATFSIDNF